VAFEPVLTSFVREPDAHTLDFYLQRARGYEGLRKALTQQPNDLIEMVKASGLRGRGGAGFPTGMKWQFVDRKSEKPRSSSRSKASARSRASSRRFPPSRASTGARPP